MMTTKFHAHEIVNQIRLVCERCKMIHFKSPSDAPEPGTPFYCSDFPACVEASEKAAAVTEPETEQPQEISQPEHEAAETGEEQHSPEHQEEHQGE